METIKIKNTMTGKKEILDPVEPGHIKIYACGVTVYDDSHIGHAMQAVFFDVIRNYLEYAGYKVTYVRNYTDVDDKIIARAKEKGISPLSLSKQVIDSTDRDMRNLGLRPATFEPKVSEMIKEIIDMVQTLIDNESAYAAPNGDVYYRVRKKADYGKLSNRKPDDMRSGTRDLAETEKEDPLDFVLWKKEEVQDAAWDSPWGRGRPGWHIECSAMAKQFLGKTFDIHGGGRDLVFPHHENEIAQSESANKCEYANVWIHSGLLTIDKQKMSKSLGNHISINQFLQEWPAEVLKLSYLERHYSSNIDFSNKVFKDGLKKLLYYYETIAELEKIAKQDSTQKNYLMGFDPEKIRSNFKKQMNDDFGTPSALVEIATVFKTANQILKKKDDTQKFHTAFAILELVKELGKVLNLFHNDASTFIEDLKNRLLPDLHITREEISEKISQRNAARENKDWSLSDQIRDELLAKGIELRDNNSGTNWTIAQI